MLTLSVVCTVWKVLVSVWKRKSHIVLQQPLAFQKLNFPYKSFLRCLTAKHFSNSSSVKKQTRLLCHTTHANTSGRLLFNLSDGVNTVISYGHNFTSIVLNKTCSTETHKPGGHVNPHLALLAYTSRWITAAEKRHSVTKVTTRKLSLIVHLNHPALINLEEWPIPPQH